MHPRRIILAKHPDPSPYLVGTDSLQTKERSARDRRSHGKIRSHHGLSIHLITIYHHPGLQVKERPEKPKEQPQLEAQPQRPHARWPVPPSAIRFRSSPCLGKNLGLLGRELATSIPAAGIDATPSSRGLALGQTKCNTRHATHAETLACQAPAKMSSHMRGFDTHVAGSQHQESTRQYRPGPAGTTPSSASLLPTAVDPRICCVPSFPELFRLPPLHSTSGAFPTRHVSLSSVWTLTGR